MDKKIVFFDIDGTLVCTNDIDGSCHEYILESTKQAIKQTRKKGNLVYLCTGRSKAEIYDFILDLGIDGIIGAGGGYVETNNTVLYHKQIHKKQVTKLVEFFDKYQFDYYLESNGGLFASKYLVPRLEKLIYGDMDNDPNAPLKRKQKVNPFIAAMQEGFDMHRSDINKACFLENPKVPFSIIKKEFENDFTVHHCTVKLFGENSGELSILGINKATAIEAVINHLGISKENTYAFGDGLNDIEMLEYCHVGIAMGDAKDGLKNIADEITDPSYEDGIYNAMKKHHLL